MGDSTDTPPPREIAGKKPRPPPSKKGGARPKPSDEGTKTGNKRSRAKQALSAGSNLLKKPHRFRPGIVAEREIRREQKSNKMATQMAPFERMVRALLADENPDLRLGGQALKALQVSAEALLTDMFRDAQEVNNLTDHDTLYVGELRRAAKEQGIALRGNSSDFSAVKIARADRARARRDRKTATAVQSDK